MKKIVLATSMMFLLAGCTGTSPFDDFAKCLNAKGAVMYGSETCTHCINQKNDFKGAFKHITYVECRQNPQACQQANIEGTPTWIMNGEKLQGRQTLEDLAEWTSCPLTKNETGSETNQ